MTETQLKIKVLKYLRSLPNVWAYKASDKFTSGIPDIIGCRNGRLLAIELKVGKNKLTKLQEHVLGKIIEANGIAFVAYSIDDVKKEVQTWTKKSYCSN